MDEICRRTALSKEEIELIIRCFNGIALPPPAVPELKLGGVTFGRNTLLSNIEGETRNAHADIAEFGVWLETFDEDAEQPYRLNDLIEKVSALSDQQAECLLWFVSGWWNARRECE